jgi:hypothetical protein
MRRVFMHKIIAGIGLLIFVFLIVANYKGATSVISTIGSNAILGIKTLQGRG